MGKSRKLIAVLLALVFMFSAMTQSAFAATEASFSDITGHWAREEILRWSGNGVLAGNNGKFRPNEGITRAEFCAVINRVFGYVEKSDTLYSDVKSDKWYAGQIAIADAAGYISGYGNGKFGPEDIITRQDAAKMLKAAFKLDVKDAGTVISFNDNSGISSYAKDAVAILSSKGYIEGSNNHFYPQKSLTRAELAVIMDRAVGQLYSTAGTYSDGQVKDNVIVKTGAVVLKNMVIEGNLYLTEGVGQGNVTLNNVTVKGKTFANGGGENSIILQNTTLTTLVVEKKDGKIRILAQEGSSVANVQLNSGAKLQEEGANTQGFGDVEVLQILPGQQLVLDGDFEVVDIAASGVAVQITDGKVGNLNVAANASGSSIQIASGAQVSTLKADAAVSVGGEGQITKAQINATNVTIAQKPTTVEVAQGVTANVGGNTVTPPASNNSGSPSDNTPPPMWTLTWADEFNGTTVDTSKWNLVNNGGGFGNQEAQYYSPDNATIQNGNLVIEAKKEQHANATSETYTSAKLVSKFSQKYGKIEARIKLPTGDGLWPAFWMMPQNNEYGVWAASGEIDIMEARGRLPQTVCGTLHYGKVWPGNVYSGKDYVFPEAQDISQFHTYTVEWEPGEFRWYVDGVLYQTQNNWYTMGTAGEEKFAFPAPFDKAFFIQLNLAVGGTFDGMRLPPDDLFNSPVNMEVDYVRVYELTGRPYKTPVEPTIAVETLPEGARVADETGNLVKDVNFEQGIKDNAEGANEEFGEVWNFVHNAQFSGAATTAVEEIDGTNYAKINVTNKGTQPYSIQLEQLTTLGKGRWYRYSFDAKADKSRTLSTKLGGGPTAGWAAYSGSYAPSLTTEVQHFSYDFQMTKDTDILTRIEYNCATDTGAVWIGNVRVEEIDPPVVDYNAAKEALPSGNLVYNGAFDKYTIDRMAYWNVTKTDAAAAASVSEATRELKVDITNSGADASAITVDQKGLKLLQNIDYKLSIKARADSARTIKLKFVSKDGSTEYLAEQEISLTSSMTTFDVPFKMEAATDREAQLIFMLGGNNADVYLDDVSLISTTNVIDPNVELFPLKNGDFSNPTLDPWKPYPVEGGAADYVLEDGMAKIIPTQLGGNPWCVMLAQEGLEFSQNVDYILEFDAKASVARKIGVILEKSTRRFDQTVSLTTEMQHFKFVFRPQQDETLDLKFLLGNIEGAALSDIYIDNVVCEVKAAKQSKNILENGTFLSGTEGWVINHYDGTANETHEADSGVLNVAISNVGTANWAIQAEQENVTIENGKNYVLTFSISSDVERDIQVCVEHKGDPYTKYLDVQTIHLTPDTKTYNFNFAGPSTTDAGSHLTFMLGNINGAVDPHTVSISDVSIIENPYGFTPPPPPLSHDLLNGTFDTNTDNWSVYKGDSSDAVISAENGKMKVDFPNYDGWFVYSTQVYQDHIALKAGKTYSLSFSVVSTLEKPIIVSVEKASDYNVKYLVAQSIQVTTADQIFTYDFTMGEEGETDAKVLFQLGSNNVPGEQFTSHSIFIDNVTLVETVNQPSGVDIVADGDFAQDKGAWDSWWGDQWSGVSTGDAFVIDGKLSVEINGIGTASYSPQVFRPNLTLVEGKTYDISFKARASEARKMNVNIGKPLNNDPYFINYADTQVIDLTTTMEEYQFSFTVTEDTCDTIKLVFELGNITGGNACPVVVEFDDVTITPQ